MNKYVEIGIAGVAIVVGVASGVSTSMVINNALKMYVTSFEEGNNVRMLGCDCISLASGGGIGALVGEAVYVSLESLAKLVAKAV